LETRIRQLAETQFRAAEMEGLQVKSRKPEAGSPKSTADLHNLNDLHDLHDQ
jgi:hypothetical protein